MSAELLRGAAELATLTGAADAAIVVGRGGDLELIDSMRGSFSRRTIAAERCPQLASAGSLAQAAGPWLGADALAELYLPLHAHVLALPCTAEGFSGALLLRYDRRPSLSPADHVFLASAAAHVANAHAEARAALLAAAPIRPVPVAAPAAPARAMPLAVDVVVPADLQAGPAEMPAAGDYAEAA